MACSKISITIVIPVYNEEKRILPTIQKVINYMSQKDLEWDLNIVDDGSIDNTVNMIQDIKNPKISILKLGKNFGKGKAVREGMLKGTGQYLLFMDADSSTSIEEFEKFLQPIKEHKDIIIGTRKSKGAQILKHQPLIREFFGKGFTWLSNAINQTHVSDFTCGFKCFSQKAAKDIFNRSVIDDWAFDTEILFIAQKLGYEITEIPVKWENNLASKVRLVHDILHSMKGLLLIRMRDLKGAYR